tara:strand:- start:70 stop:393 length:324 start_codon:yes stop_codon:yes gene_type:complete
MGHSRKIATCCYCGRRSELVLSGRVQHELSCGSCGAPLHNMKRVPSQPVPPEVSGVQPRERTYYRDPYPQARPDSYKPHKTRKQKRRKPWGRKLFEEIVDAVEDIFD